MKKNVRWIFKCGFFRVAEGYCAAAWTSRGLSALRLPEKFKATALRRVRDALPPKANLSDTISKVPFRIVLQARRVLSGKSHRVPPLDLSFLTPFQRRVLAATVKIPVGETRTYSWVARRAGIPAACRAAGQALNRNPVPLLVPCHRVTASGGGLGGFGAGLAWKRRLLAREHAARLR